MSDKPKFDPNQGFQVAEKPAFDPNQTFTPATEKSVLQKILSAADYQRGQVVPRIAKALGGNVSDADIAKANTGDAPSAKEILEKSGVKRKSLSDVFPNAFTKTEEEGKNPIRLKFAKGGLADISNTGAIGLLADTLGDPLTYETMGIGKVAKAGTSGISKLAKFLKAPLTPISTVAEHAAYPVYKGAVHRADAAIIKNLGEGAVPTSKTLFDEGIYGTPSSLRGGASNVIEKLGNERSDLYKTMPAIDTSKIPYKSASDTSLKYSAHPVTANDAENANELIKEMNNRGLVQPDAFSNQKTISQRLANKMGQYGADPRFTVKGEVLSDIASADRQALEDAAESVAKGGGTHLSGLNQKMQSLLAGDSQLANQAAISGRKKGFTVMDAMYGPGVTIATGDPTHGITAAAIKKLGDLWNSPTARSSLGIGLKGVGKESAWDILARRGLLNKEVEK